MDISDQVRGVVPGQVFHHGGAVEGIVGQGVGPDAAEGGDVAGCPGGGKECDPAEPGALGAAECVETFFKGLSLFLCGREGLGLGDQPRAAEGDGPVEAGRVLVGLGPLQAGEVVCLGDLVVGGIVLGCKKQGVKIFCTHHDP